ncbi:MAG TPA: alpha-1,4-glucan--maltose-1-phosphate maltosyltransferase [Terriglobales bacterium]|nr:alpha-1,4-glucan--maltose-1-phosphate maltosyltransferase [Terriglobales bacterium]
MPERTAIEARRGSTLALEKAARLPLTSPPRVVVENVLPQLNGGRFAVKRVTGEKVEVTADIFSDGHDRLAAILRYRQEDESSWREVRMRPIENDRWAGSFTPQKIGVALYNVEAWIDQFQTWRDGFRKKIDAGVDISVEVLIGAELISAAAKRAREKDREQLQRWEKELKNPAATLDFKSRLGLDEELLQLMDRYPDKSYAAIGDYDLRVVVDPPLAGFSAWYEFFPRSAPRKGEHGTLRDAADHLPYVAEMGFNVVYLPPIHPIGNAHRKGKNNNPQSESGAVGSPWAIGSEAGGHTAIHPELGTLGDFDEFVTRARELHLEMALDIAFQVSPDHPYVREHPEWFRWRPDKTVQYAENPPKKYQDIYPFEFENADWQNLWLELKNVFLFWCEHGVRVFRVDNPHTKPFAFWEWLIAEVKREFPETVFLSEAFTRPKIMYRLAKLGFTQSYTYFAWRNTKAELTEYLQELTQTEVKEFFRPNLWPNTPDILTEKLQNGGRAAFISRLVLAATLSSNYGIYGPAFELMESVAVSEGKEEYLDSEKYEIKKWELDRPDSLSPIITRVNAARRKNAALQSNHSVNFLEIDNDALLAHCKSTPDFANVIVTVVNLDPKWRQSGWLRLPLEELHIDPARPFMVHDLLTGSQYQWFGPLNYVELDPNKINAHIFRVTQGE